MSIQLVVKFDVKAEHLEQFVQLMQGAKARILAVPGCERVELLQGVEKPNIVALSEIWVSQEVHDQYAEKMAAAGSMRALGSMLNGEPVTELYAVS